MGLFDDAFSEMSPGEAMGKHEAFAGILLSAVASDGHISDEEARGLNHIVSRMKLFEDVDGNKYSRMIDRLLGVLKRNGHEELVEKAAAALPEDLRGVAFCNACDLVLADQGIEDEEKEFLSKLRQLLDVSKEQAQKIFRVMVIKNKG